MVQFLAKERRVSLLEVVVVGAMLAMCLAGCSSSYVPTEDARRAHEERLNDGFHRMNGPAGVRGASYPHNYFLP